MATISFDLLDTLLSPIAERRHAAEEYFKNLGIDQRCSGLMQILQQQQNNDDNQKQRKAMAAILLRHDIILLSDPVQLLSLVDPLILFFLNIETSNKKFVGDCLAEVCSSLQFIDSKRSLSAFQQITNAIGASAFQGELCSLQLLISLAERAEKSFAVVVMPSLPALLTSAFTELQSYPPKVVSLLHLVLATASYNLKTDLDCCLISLLTYFQQHQGPWVTKVIELLHQAIEENLPIFTESLEVWAATLQLCLQTVRISDQNYGLALNTIQVISLLTAADQVGRNLLRSSSHAETLLQTTDDSILGTCLRIMYERVDDVEVWELEPASLNEDGLDGDEDTDCSYAELLLVQLISNLGSAAVEVLIHAIQPFVLSTNRDWKAQRAALSALQCCAEGAPISFTPHLNAALEFGVALSSSNNSRVQYQAILCLGVLCDSTYFEDGVRNVGAAVLLKTFAVASQNKCTKVAALACMGIVSYCRPAGTDLDDAQTFVNPYIYDILSALVSGPLRLPMSDMGAITVKLRAIGAVACLAATSGDFFAQFYAEIMPLLLDCAHIPSDGNFDKMRLIGAALECATIVGQSISDEHSHLFLNDARQILLWVLPAIEDTDRSSVILPLDHVLAACARIASVLGEEYAPYAKVVIPQLIKRATDNGDVDFSEGNLNDLESSKKCRIDMEGDSGIEAMTIAVPGRGLTKVTVNTSKILDKVQAARAVYEHAVALRDCFEQYTIQCFDAFLPLVHFRFSGSMRVAAAQTLAAVFDASCQSNTIETSEMYLPLVTNAICMQLNEEDENDAETLQSMYVSLCDIFRIVYFLDQDIKERIHRQLTIDNVKAIVQQCMKSMTACLQRRSNITATFSKNQSNFVDEDELDDYERLLRQEQDLLTPLVDTVGYVIKLKKQSFTPIFESEVSPVLLPYLSDGKDIRARVSATCLFDDVIEHCGVAAAIKFSPCVIGSALLGIDDTTNGNDLDLKSASIYGITQVARYAPSAIPGDTARIILQHLGSLTSMPKEVSENLTIYENAISCIASLILFDTAPFRSAGYLKLETFLGTFLESLPLSQDPDEAKICHAGLCTLIEHGIVDVNSSYDTLLRIIVETLELVEEGEDVADPATCKKYADIFFHLQNEDQSGRVDRYISSLTFEKQEAIRSTLSEYSPHRNSNLITP